MSESFDQREAALRVQTLGSFQVWRDDQEIEVKTWGREKALHLFQFLVTHRLRALHKEQIIDRLWPQVDLATGDRDFKVALNAVNKVLEPDRPPRALPRFIQRVGLTYQFDLANLWVDADAFEDLVTAGNRALPEDEKTAREAYASAVGLYQGDYLPERRYEDWTSAERERLQTLALGAMTTLAELSLETTPLESIRLCQKVLELDPVWENAYRTMMRAYLATGNRPLALRTYQRCVEVLEQEFDVAPLPETKELYKLIRQIE